MKSISRRSLFGISAAALVAPLLPKQAEAEEFTDFALYVKAKRAGRSAVYVGEWYHGYWSYTENPPPPYRSVVKGVPPHPHWF